MRKIYVRAFTLVELLVVITLLTILGTIAFIVFEGNVSESRDAARQNDLNEIVNTLELFQTENGFFPDPSDMVEVTYSGAAIAWKQGTFGESVGRIIKVFGSDVPKDPKFKNFYTYSITARASEFQIAGIRENLQEEEGLGEEVSFLSSPSAHAGSVEVAFVKGDYNGIVLKAQTAGIEHFIASPSIIATDLSNPDVLDIITQKKLVYDEFFNIPSSYSGYLDLDGGFNFNVLDPVVYSGDIQNLRSESELLDFNERLKYIYATTPTESFDKYISVLEDDGLTGLKGFLTRKFKIIFRTYFNCKDILDDGLDDGDRMYTIDPDGPGGKDAYQVFCDMTTDGGGWTRVGDNHLIHADFSGILGGTGAVSYPGTENNIVNLSTEIDGNTKALHQTGNYSSYYRVSFDSPELLKPGYELRLTTWRSDYGSGSNDASVGSAKILAGKFNYWTPGTCTSNPTSTSCRFSYFNQKMNNAANFGPGGNLTEIPISLVSSVSNVSTPYLNGGILFDGYIPQGQTRSTSLGNISPYSTSEIQAIDDWVHAGGFLLSTNDEARWDPLGEYYGMPSGGLHQNVSKYWEIQNVDHPIVNGSIGLKVDLRGKTLIGEQAYSALIGEILPDDVVLARDKYAPYLPTVVLRRVGKGYALITSDEGVFRNMSAGNTFDKYDNEDAFAAGIMAFAIETAAGINPHEGYVFHNRLFYNDGTFSTNGKDTIVDTIKIQEGGQERVWTKELVRHKIYKTPENFHWYIGLDANNNKDLYFTGMKLELFYR